MDDIQKLLLNPHKQLLFAVSNTRHLLGSLSEEVETLDALVNDFGEKMSPDIRERWKSKLSQILQSCEVNSLGLTDETQGLCLATLCAIEGKFYEVIDKNPQDAGGCYERAAKVLASMPKPQLEKLMTTIAKGSLASLEGDSTSNKKEVKFEEGLGVVLAFSYRLPEAELWNYAGDNYCRAGTIESGRRCYDVGLQVSNEQLTGEVVESWATALRRINCRLSLSLAVAVLIPSNEWEHCESLYRKASDNIFFKIDKKDNVAYQDICGILVYGSGITPYGFVEPDWFPRVPVSTAVQKNEQLLRLKAELGKRTLDTLRTDFEKSEEGYPVPETYFLIMILSDIYRRLGEHEKCINLITSGSHDFDDAFYEWTYDELTKAHDWAFSFIEHSENVSFARGLLQRPDYKEFVERMKKAEESHQRLEWRQIRFEKVLEGVGDKISIEEVRNQFTSKNPWLEEAANPGSVLNAELLYRQLKKTNWGEVVMGYCNAVEEELKDYIYKKYLAYIAGQPDRNYAQESQRQNNQGSVLYFIAGMASARLKDRLWDY